jgi:cytochrome c
MPDGSRRHRGAAHLLIALAIGGTLSACRQAAGDDSAPRLVSGGDADRGQQLIGYYGCGSCHMIPGVAVANGLVGPPLVMWSRRIYIAGEVPNTPDFLIRWIEMPQAIEPDTDMPNLGVTEGNARDIAAYLYTLR